MTATARSLTTPPRLFAVGAATLVAGRLLDAWWHSGHEEFETGADQIQAHWLVWLGTLVLVAAGAQGVRERLSAGYAVLLGGALAYAVLAALHFYEHTEGREVDLTHALLVVANIVIVVAVIWVAAAGRRRARG